MDKAKGGWDWGWQVGWVGRGRVLGEKWRQLCWNNKNKQTNNPEKKLHHLFYYCSNTVVSLFPPPLSPAPPLPHSILPPFGFIHGSFLHVPWWQFPFFSPLFPSPGNCQFFLYFMSLVIFYWVGFFVDKVLLIGKTTGYFSSTTWLTSLSIILSSSIHAVTKGRSTFLSTVVFHCVNVPQFFF